MFKKLYMMAIMGASVACQATPGDPIKVAGSRNLEPDEQQSIVCKEVTGMITNYNYKKIKLNDSISTVIFNSYIKRLDENRNYLLASDLKDFDKYKTQLDDDLQNGELNHAFYMFNVYQKRYNERIKYSLEQVNKSFDFSQKESFMFNREDQPWVSSVSDLNKFWDKRVKYDLLNLNIATPDVAKNKETLKKRYENLIAQSAKLNNQDVFQIFMDAFTESIDPHTNYFNPSNAAQFNIEMSRSLEGIGASLLSENEYVTIKTIVKGGPAEKSKQVAINDRIVGVAQGKNGEFQDIIGWRTDNAIPLIRGTKGTTVRLKLLPEGKTSTNPKIVELVRDKIVLQDQLASKEIRTYDVNGKAVKIGIIDVPAFYLDYKALQAGDKNYQSISRDVKMIIDSLKAQKVDGIVMDLRQNGGGSLPEAIQLTGLFIKTGPVVQVRDVRNKIEQDDDDDPSVAWNGPLAVMVDRFSASASEIFAGAIQDYGRGIIVGTQTYGKGTVQSAIDLDKVIGNSFSKLLASVKGKSGQTVNGSGGQTSFGQINLTIAKFYRISGSSTQHKGVIPDIQFPSAIPLDKYGEDTEPSALPFDMIAKGNYATTGSFSAAIPQLKTLHDARMQSNVNYKNLVEDIADYKKRDAEKSVTLNEAELKKQHEEDDAKTLSHDNARRAALGLKPLVKGAPRVKDKDADFLKIEAGQILTDYIRLKPQS
ncbi:MAG: carboxy terminal-processing peptidase [Janthinobacterium lividum]